MQRGSSDLGPGALSDIRAADSLSARAVRAWVEFAEEPVPQTGAPVSPEEIEVDDVLEEFGGDIRVTIRALLSDLSVLAGDLTGAVSRGYVRSKHSEEGRRVTRRSSRGAG